MKQRRCETESIARGQTTSLAEGWPRAAILPSGLTRPSIGGSIPTWRARLQHPVFSLGTAWIPAGYEDWWERWDTAGDVTAHDNYCLLSTTTDFGSLTRSVPLAVAINREQKPMWLALQAFSGTADRKSELFMPTPEELRGMAFTSIVHGATGFIFFALDSKVTREGLVVGIAPETLPAYDKHAEVTPTEVSRSRALWGGAASLNAELERRRRSCCRPQRRGRCSAIP